MKSKLFGTQGEDKAVDFLLNKGFEILERNYRKRSGEIDIIAFDPSHKEHVFIEVKARKSHRFGFPEEAVDDKKIYKIEETGENWLMEKGIKNPKWRIDIIAIEQEGQKFNLKHIQNISLDN